MKITAVLVLFLAVVACPAATIIGFDDAGTGAAANMVFSSTGVLYTQGQPWTPPGYLGTNLGMIVRGLIFWTPGGTATDTTLTFTFGSKNTGFADVVYAVIGNDTYQLSQIMPTVIDGVPLGAQVTFALYTGEVTSGYAGWLWSTPGYNADGRSIMAYGAAGNDNPPPTPPADAPEPNSWMLTVGGILLAAAIGLRRWT